MQQPQPSADGMSQDALLASYAAQGRVHNDEMLTPDGTIKPVWQPFFEHLSRLSAAELNVRFSRGDQYLRDAGVLFRQYDETLSTEREWPLSHIPVIIGEDEWQVISD